MSETLTSSFIQSLQCLFSPSSLSCYVLAITLPFQVMKRMVWLFPQSSAIGNGSLLEGLLKIHLQRKIGLISPSFIFAPGVSGFALPHAPTVMRHLHLKLKSVESNHLGLEPPQP